MIRLDADRPATFCDGLTRRDFLHAGAIAPLGLTLAGMNRAQANGKDDDVNCIMLFLVGGPSQLDTFDPKPNAPAEVRGPFTADEDERARNRDQRDLPARRRSTPTSSRSSARSITRRRPSTTPAIR